MCILIFNGETLGVEPDYAAAAREARYAARLFGGPVTILNLKTRERVEWKN